MRRFGDDSFVFGSSCCLQINTIYVLCVCDVCAYKRQRKVNLNPLILNLAICNPMLNLKSTRVYARGVHLSVSRLFHTSSSKR